jgi:hypothetical protein
MKRFLIAPLVAASLAVAACGGDDPEKKYIQAVNEAQNSAGLRIASLAGQVTAESDKAQDGGVYEGVRQELSALAEKVRSMKDVPENLQDENDVLASTIEQIGSTVQKGAAMDPKAFASQLDTQTRTLETVVRQINDQT